jgi:hypothetical protein
MPKDMPRPTDLGRRVLLSSLDAGCERPEERRFETDVAEIARSPRACIDVLVTWTTVGGIVAKKYATAISCAFVVRRRKRLGSFYP